VVIGTALVDPGKAWQNGPYESFNGKLHWHRDPRFRDTSRRLDPRQQCLEDCARGLTLPTLLARGGQSDVLSEEGAKEFLHLARHSEYVNVSGAAHMVAGDRNDHFGRVVRIPGLQRARRRKASSSSA
jgi:pimeloyl-ACP methyl ester carboxylesterase